ncbi:hypothetical protein JCM3774_004075 [Rhodotorula dairenensis]
MLANRASQRANSSHQPFEENPTMQRFVIGKIDAGIAVLISDSVHLIEFPSLLLPAGVGPGSIVNIQCTRNLPAEKRHAREFWDLQDAIAAEFAAREPEPPRLKIRNTTQTSVTLEWDPLDLAAADLVNLSIYRNGQRLTSIPNPTTNTSTKLSGLSLDTDYAFHLVLKTTAGTYASPVVKTRTHTIDNTTGISVCFGLVEPADLAETARRAVAQLGAKADDRIQIDTTHFVATSSATKANPNGAPGPEYQKAVQLSIPVVTPEWLVACAEAKKLVPISAYYLGQTNRAASLSSAQLVHPTPSPPAAANRKTEALARVTEEQPQVVAAAAVKPPVELEENVEAPPSDQTAATISSTAALATAAAADPQVPEPAPAPAAGPELEPEPTAPVTVKTSDPTVPAQDETVGEVDGRGGTDGHVDEADLSTRGVKSSGEEEDDAGAGVNAEQEEETDVPASASGNTAGELEAESETAPQGVLQSKEEEAVPAPPTISVTPPPREEEHEEVEEPAPEPQGELVSVQSEHDAPATEQTGSAIGTDERERDEVVEPEAGGDKAAETEAREKHESTRLGAEAEEEEQQLDAEAGQGGVDDAGARAEVDDGKEGQGEEDHPSADADTSLVDVTL